MINYTHGHDKCEEEAGQIILLNQSGALWIKRKEAESSKAALSKAMKAFPLLTTSKPNSHLVITAGTP